MDTTPPCRAIAQSYDRDTQQVGPAAEQEEGQDAAPPAEHGVVGPEHLVPEDDAGVGQALGDRAPDLCVLAGYMLVVGPEMCQHYKMINLHPAAPGGPKGTWQEVIWQLIASEAAETGVMMHLVTPELDEGPPVTYCVFPIRGEPFDRHWEQLKGLPVKELKAREGENHPLFKLIRHEGMKRELPLVVTTVKAFSEGRVRIEKGKIIDTRGKIVKGYSLTREIDAIVGASA